VTTSTIEAAAVQKLFTAIMNVKEGVLNWNKSLLDLHDTLVHNGRAIDDHTGLVAMNTQAGIANRHAVLAAMTANMQEYQSFIAAGGSAADATAQYDRNTAALEDLLHQAHFSQKQIDDMIGSLKRVPGETHADIITKGLTDAINNLANLMTKLAELNGNSYGFSVTEYLKVGTPGGIESMMGQARGGIYEHADVGKLRDAQVYSPASGGPARYAFAEPATGGEAFVPKVGDYSRSTSILDRASRWYGGRFMPDNAGGGGATMINITVHAGMGTDGMQVGRQIAKALATYTRANGGNVQAAVVR